MPPVSSWTKPARPDSSAPSAVVRTPRIVTIVPSAVARASAMDTALGVGVGVGVDFSVGVAVGAGVGLGVGAGVGVAAGVGAGDGPGVGVGVGRGGRCRAGGRCRDWRRCGGRPGRRNKRRAETLGRRGALHEPVRAVVVGIATVPGRPARSALEARASRRRRCGATLHEPVRSIAPANGIHDRAAHQPQGHRTTRGGGTARVRGIGQRRKPA